MKSLGIAKPNTQKYIFTKPFKISDFSFDEFDDYDDLDDAWQEKSRRLQARRWRKIKHQLI